MATDAIQDIILPLPQWKYQQLEQRAENTGVRPVDVVAMLVDRFLSNEDATQETHLAGVPLKDIGKRQAAALKKFMDVMDKDDAFQSDENYDDIQRIMREVRAEKAATYRRAIYNNIPSSPHE